MLITLDNLGQFGVLRDGLPHELPDNAWSDGLNVRFREGYAEKFLGYTQPFGVSPIVPYHVAPLAAGAYRYWVEAGLTKIYAVDSGATHSNITRQTASVDVDYAATANQGWTSSVLGGILVLNNGVDIPQAWAGTGKCVNLANWPSTLRAKSVRAYRSFLVALNCTKSSTSYPYLVKWSHSADPGAVPSSWDETDPTKDCGEYDLSDTPSVLVDGMVLGDSLILYKEGAYYSLTDVGGQTIMRSQLISSEAGALADNCVAAFPLGHCVFGPGDVFVHQGGAPETILTARARRWLYANLDPTYFQRSYVVANPLESEIWICFPSLGSQIPNLALVWNHKTNTLGPREINARHGAVGIVAVSASDTWAGTADNWNSTTGDLWDQPSTAQSIPRLALAGDSLQLMESGATLNGTNMTARLERTGLSFGAPERVKLLKGLRPQFEAAPGSQLAITLGGAFDVGGPVTWGDPITFTVGSDIQADGFASGRFLAVRIESTTDVSWRLKQMALDVESMGAY